jgi:hypothetical protein
MLEKMCFSCRRPKAVFLCELCQESICQDCARILEISTFSFLKKIPQDLSHTRYCQACFGLKVEPTIDSYNAIMSRAEELYVFFTSQKRQIPLIRRARSSVKVEACVDRNETLLRLAFFAAEQGFNAIIETEVTSKKIRNEGYQKTQWQGSAVPAQVDVERLERVSFK